MEILFVHSHIFKFDEKNNFYSDGKLTYSMWKERYLNYFDNIIIAARASKIGREELNLSSGPRVNHFVLPNLSNIKGRYRNKKRLNNDLERLIKQTDVVVSRMPSEHAYYAIKIAQKLNKPYVIEVVGDVFSSLWNHGNIFGKILAPVSYIKYRRVIKRGSYLIYVTKNNLQDRYPYNPKALVTNISNVDITLVSENILKSKIHNLENLTLNDEVKIGLIGSYSSRYKGIDTAIKTVKNLNQRGYNCKLIVLGSGDNKWLIDLAEKLNIRNKITFTGSLPGGEKVFEWLDTIDIYIQPSLTEGLPRALIEAMSRGLPCVASSVGGIPELINSEFLHKPKQEKELTEKIEYLLKNKDVMLNQAGRNYKHAKEYTKEVLNARRRDFWSEFIERELIKK
ncbi:glycosyltransferase [Oceanobacillus profundus]|uniref:glycosyltransferase n=1 Tax=Oceanobacillus profundus TaxID=372463 RepID=UPI0026E24953|nr:glycosyltransferase [Oceanobacillus profundus]MDO6450500.1 glycosyltransferase [Oceanobacillus profundus]